MRVSLGVLSAVLLLAGCATPNAGNHTAEAIQREMSQAAQPVEVNNALLPPLSVEMPAVEDKPLEPRFDLVVSATPVQQVFMAIVSGTRYSMLVHPEVAGNISLNLKDVTMFEALESIRDMYGYDYKVSGERIFIQPLTMQTRLFQVNYLTGTRAGTSSVRVTSSALADSPGSSSAGGGSQSSNQGTTIVGGGEKSSLSFERGSDNSSKITTTTSTDFWDELQRSLGIILGGEEKQEGSKVVVKLPVGRSLSVSPMSGVIVVRAMPDELKNVAAYLKASQISIERQVILEAKIIEVQLSNGYQSGVNWAGFNRGNMVAGQVSQVGNAGSIIASGMGVAAPAPTVADAVAVGLDQATIIARNASKNALGNSLAGLPGGMFGMALGVGNFAALLNFLESQGNVHVLSSPRIATLNNQKAVLKVGTDEFFVTEISGGTQATANVAGTAPTVKVQPFFSGIALDVTPRIDENNEIILHVHPSVSAVSTVNKTLNLGTGIGTYNLPLASSSVSETDSIVRARDGQIVVIGGLMRQATFDVQSGLPGMPKQILGQTSKTSEKRELVILLKPTVVDNDKDWSQDISQSRDRFGNMAGQGGRP